MNDAPVVVGAVSVALVLVVVLVLAYVLGAEKARVDWVRALHVAPTNVIDAARECRCTCDQGAIHEN